MTTTKTFPKSVLESMIYFKNLKSLFVYRIDRCRKCSLSLTKKVWFVWLFIRQKENQSSSPLHVDCCLL